MSNETDTTHNGWANYETWLVNLWLTNEPETSDDLSGIAMTDTETISERADTLKRYVEEVCDMPETGLASDLLNASLGRVDFHEIIRNHEDDGDE